ncbi:MAG: lipoprotein-releasing ABC transporter permease subunit [Acidiferrobacterales bacterium]
MIRPLELFIGLRYTRARRHNHFISFISLMATLGIVLGVAVLITVLSVMSGFGNELRQRILSVVSHVTITEGWNGLSRWQQVANIVSSQKNVIAVAPYIEGQGLVIRGRDAAGVLVRGVIPSMEKKVSLIAEKMITGTLSTLQPTKRNIILGYTLARTMGVKEGDRVALVVQTGGQTNRLPNMMRMTVSGLFDVGMQQFDGALVLVHQSHAAKLFRTLNDVTGLRVKLDNGELAPLVGATLVNQLGTQYRARDWTQQHRNFFIALQDQKRILFIVLMLIVAVAAFNIISTLVMMVTDKQGDIAILQTLGLSPGSIMLVFIIQGSVLALAGTLLGASAGVLLAINVETIVSGVEQLVGFNFLASDVYPMTDLPAQLNWDDIATIVGASFVLGVGATLYPAWRAARVQPAEALRYE